MTKDDNAIFRYIQDGAIEKARNEQRLYRHIFVYDITPLLVHFRFSEFRNKILVGLIHKEKEELDNDILNILDKTVLICLTENIMSSTSGNSKYYVSLESLLEDISSILSEDYRVNLIFSLKALEALQQDLLDYLELFEKNLLKLTMYFVETSDNVNNGEIDTLENLNGKFKLDDVYVRGINGNETALLTVSYYFNFIDSKYEK